MGTIMMALLGGSMLCGAADGVWMAGVARADITPQEPMWLAGYAARDREAEGALHPLWIKALALRDAAGNQAVLVTADILGFPKAMSDRIRDRLRDRLGLERAAIILNASHTHSGPVINESLMCMYPLDSQGIEKVKRYSDALEDRVVSLVEAAFADMRPAQLASANGVTRFAVNRRNNKEAEILDTYDFKGPVDHAVPVLRVTGADGAVAALVFGYACHGTVLSGYEWCGDYPGYAQIAIEAAHPGATALFFAGCGADQNPLPRRSVALAEQYGKELAAAVERALADPMRAFDPVLQTAYIEQELLLETPPTRDQLVAYAKTAAPHNRNAAEAMIAQLDAGQSLRTSYPYPVQLWRLGEQNVVALGGEVVVDYAIFIKRLLGRDTFVMGFSNDLMSYIPSVRVLNEGGYEGETAQMEYGMPAKWRNAVERRVLDTVKELAARLGALPRGETP
ncbi:MAG TPA: neutral/alkaline non-lysosomal ceramidase N-terminal domain-containing protein [Candidatus Hydrogenedentes bacterium]|nr:neutral/alkaline non-lysosomal ceramidase N-terminal domain-containing protein [Candidatus Hydrogenedentota bacterium]